MAKPRYEKMRSPAGIALFPYLTRPDTEYQPEGEYKVDIVLDPADDGVQDFVDGLIEKNERAAQEVLQDQPAAKRKKAVTHCPITPEEDRESGEETGRYVLRVKMKAKVKPKDGDEFEQRPKLFDAKGNKIDPEKIRPWTGTKLKAAFELVPYFNAATSQCGLTLRLKAVQILELVEGEGSAESYGFEEEEGFSASGGEDDDEF